MEKASPDFIFLSEQSWLVHDKQGNKVLPNMRIVPLNTQRVLNGPGRLFSTVALLVPFVQKPTTHQSWLTLLSVVVHTLYWTKLKKMIKLKGVKDWLHVLYICLPSRYPDVTVPEWTLLQVHMSDWKWKQCEPLPFVTDGCDSLQLRLRVQMPLYEQTAWLSDGWLPSFSPLNL